MNGGDRKRYEIKASAKGFRAYLEYDIELNLEYKIRITIAPNVMTTVVARAVWGHHEKGVGFEIIKSDKNWNLLIDQLSEGSSLSME